MDICKFGHTYEIQEKIKSNTDYDVYRCRKSTDNGDKSYSIICLKNIENRSKAFEFPSFLSGIYNVEELIEFFQQDNDFYLVFASQKGELLYEKLSEKKYSRLERMVITHSMLRKLANQDIPYYFACQGLKKSNVFVLDDWKVSFSYELEDVEQHSAYTMADVCKELDAWIGILFQEEIRSPKSKELNNFLKALKNADFKSYQEINRAYAMSIEELLLFYESQEEVLPVTFVTRYKGKIKEYLKAIGIVLLIYQFLFAVILIGLYVESNAGIPIADNQKTILEWAGFSFTETVEIGKWLYLGTMFLIVVFLIIHFFFPEIQPKFIIKTMVVNSAAMTKYSGKVKLLNEKDNKLLFEGMLKKGRIMGEGILYDYNGNLVYQGGFTEEYYEKEDALYLQTGYKICNGSFVK